MPKPGPAAMMVLSSIALRRMSAASLVASCVLNERGMPVAQGSMVKQCGMMDSGAAILTRPAPVLNAAEADNAGAPIM